MKKCINLFLLLPFLLSSFLLSFSDVIAQETEIPVWYENPPDDTDSHIFVVEKGENSLEAVTLALGKLANKIYMLEKDSNDEPYNTDGERTITVHTFGDYEVATIFMEKADPQRSQNGKISEKAIRIKFGDQFRIEYFSLEDPSFASPKTEITYSTTGGDATFRNLLNDLRALDFQFTTQMSLTETYVMISMPVDHR